MHDHLIQHHDRLALGSVGCVKGQPCEDESEAKGEACSCRIERGREGLGAEYREESGEEQTLEVHD